MLRTSGRGALRANFAPGRSFDRAGCRFQCSSCLLAMPGIFYKPVSRVRHQTIDILCCRGPQYPPFRKEHAHDRVLLLA